LALSIIATGNLVAHTVAFLTADNDTALWECSECSPKWEYHWCGFRRTPDSGNDDCAVDHYASTSTFNDPPAATDFHVELAESLGLKGAFLLQHVVHFSVGGTTLSRCRERGWLLSCLRLLRNVDLTIQASLTSLYIHYLL
jgi:hypothetical protein